MHPGRAASGVTGMYFALTAQFVARSSWALDRSRQLAPLFVVVQRQLRQTECPSTGAPRGHTG